MLKLLKVSDRACIRLLNPRKDKLLLDIQELQEFVGVQCSDLGSVRSVELIGFLVFDCVHGKELIVEFAKNIPLDGRAALIQHFFSCGIFAQIVP